jgi:lantibiotic leader peptide-processing serine protease
VKPNRTGCALLVAGLVALAGCARDVTAPAATPRTPSHSAAAVVDGQYLVLFKGNGIPADFQAQVEAAGGTVTFTHDETGFAIVGGLDAAGAASIGALNSVAQVEADAAFSIDDPQAAVEVEAPQAAVEVEASEVAGGAVQSVANPTTALLYAWQWNMRLIHANTAWAAGKLGSPGVTVAIIDSGLDYNTPDLNGLVDLSRSVSLVPSDNALRATYFPNRHPVTDFNGHGTNVASQVSSRAFLFAGVTSRTTLIGVKVLNWEGEGNVGAALSGVLWAADHGANVANMSLGGAFSKVANGPLLSLITRVFNYANHKGMLIVVSAGNHIKDLDHNEDVYLAYCNTVHVVCVSAVGPEVPSANPDNVAWYSDFGRSAITVAAPGGNADAAHGFPLSVWPWGLGDASLVWSYCPKNYIEDLTPAGVPLLTACSFGNRLIGRYGTSQAAPHVAGLAALLMAEYGTGNVGFIKNRLTSSALDLGQPGTDPFYGRGRIDVAEALGL